MLEDEPLAANPLLTPRMVREVHAEAHGWSLSCCRGRREEALEVLQTAYVQILEGRARYDGRSAPRTWMFGLVRNLARSRWRRQLLARRFEAAQAGSEPAAEAHEPESDATQARLLRALDALPRRQREVLELVFRHELSIEQAAAVMGVALGSARVHYERGKQRLRREFGGTEAT